MNSKNNIVGIRHIENVPPGKPYVVAWFDEDGSMYWNCKEVTNYQLSYLGTKLCVEALKWGQNYD